MSACAAAGALCAFLGTPLPWIIGPLVAMAVLRVVGFDLRAPRGARTVGQVLIATALGLYFTPSVAHQVAAYWFVLIIAGTFALRLRSLAATSVPGGASEMANLGDRFGGQVDRIAVAQSLRILLVVIIVPFSLALADIRGTDAYDAVRVPVVLPMLALLLACALCGGLFLALAGAPNGWMLGALGVTIALTASGMEWSSMPPVLTNTAQMLIGCSLGQRFDRDFMRSAPRYVAVVCALTVGSLVISALFGAALAALAGLPVPTLVLATAPGGIAEMCLTARNLGLGVPLVTAAHVVRVV